MRVTWITSADAPSIVHYGTTSGKFPFSETGTTSSYSYRRSGHRLYRSGKIHHVVVGPLKPSTRYYYRCSSDRSRQFSFRTPPASLPFKFVIVGTYKLTFFRQYAIVYLNFVEGREKIYKNLSEAAARNRITPHPPQTALATTLMLTNT